MTCIGHLVVTTRMGSATKSIIHEGVVIMLKKPSKKGKQLQCIHHAIIINRMLVRNDHLH
jgi:hypothetical protein